MTGDELLREEHRRHTAAYRERNPGSVSRDGRRHRARYRAMVRVARAHPEEFEAARAEEERQVGL